MLVLVTECNLLKLSMHESNPFWVVSATYNAIAECAFVLTLTTTPPVWLWMTLCICQCTTLQSKRTRCSLQGYGKWVPPIGDHTHPHDTYNVVALYCPQMLVAPTARAHINTVYYDNEYAVTTWWQTWMLHTSCLLINGHQSTIGCNVRSRVPQLNLDAADVIRNQ